MGKTVLVMPRQANASETWQNNNKKIASQKFSEVKNAVEVRHASVH